MFEQFRSRFPQGSLTSELVQIDHGKYIVRASVCNEGFTLATGLAAADTIEQAEDQARTRALAVLDISLTPTPSPPKTWKEFKNGNSGGSEVETEKPVTVSTPQKPVSSQRAFLETPPSSSVPSASDESETETQAEMSSSFSLSQTQDTQPNHVSEETPETSVSEGNETLLDSSDIIARTNVELRRLDWTTEQGRKFLEQTYGKRSRTMLSDAELREFLEYLEKQPTPPQEDDQ